MLCDVVCPWAHVPMIHATSHFYDEKRVAWVFISMHACDPVPIVMVLCLAAPWAARAPLKLRKLNWLQHTLNNFSLACFSTGEGSSNLNDRSLIVKISRC